MSEPDQNERPINHADPVVVAFCMALFKDAEGVDTALSEMPDTLLEQLRDGMDFLLQRIQERTRRVNEHTG